EIKLFGNNFHELLTLAPRVAHAIGGVRGVVDVRDGIVYAGDALEIHVSRSKAALEGMDPNAITRQVTAYLRGVVTTRVQRGVKFIGVRVWVPKPWRATTGDVGRLLLRAPDGHVFPLSRVAKVVAVSGQPEITREDLKRMVAVTARISGRSLGATIHDVRKALARPGLIPSNVYIKLGGLYKQQQIAFRGLMAVFVAAVALVFLLLLFLYERLRIALSILAAPLLAVGAVFIGLWITRTELNISSMMGMTMIVGIVTEVAIFYFSEYRSLPHNLSREQALILAGKNRMRPIAMTTFAAILALSPLALGLGQGAAMQQPLAIAIISGLAVQLPLVLLVIPVLFHRLPGKEDSDGRPAPDPADQPPGD
ncbi:MAG: efflux RND transporter permease subunit, partial [Gammaproteobacteria bacterium]|nr:efflux RND transporter permease subunit [Gammaproteobacteria bacterium]